MSAPVKNQNNRRPTPTKTKLNPTLDGPRRVDVRLPGILRRERPYEGTRQQYEEFLTLNHEVEFKFDSSVCCQHSFALVGNVVDPTTKLTQAKKVCSKCTARATFDVLVKGDVTTEKLAEYDATPPSTDERQ